MMVDHEGVKYDERTIQQIEKHDYQKWRTLKKQTFLLVGYKTASVLISFFFYVIWLLNWSCKHMSMQKISESLKIPMNLKRQNNEIETL